AVLLAAFFGALGYVFTRLECEAAPLILGFVLGPLMEENLRRAMRISSGDPAIFLERPISLGLLIAALALCVLVALPAIRSKREEASREGAHGPGWCCPRAGGGPRRARGAGRRGGRLRPLVPRLGKPRSPRRRGRTSGSRP